MAQSAAAGRRPASCARRSPPATSGYHQHQSGLHLMGQIAISASTCSSAGWAGHRHQPPTGRPQLRQTVSARPRSPAQALAGGQSRFRADIAVTGAAAGRAPAPAESAIGRGCSGSPACQAAASLNDRPPPACRMNRSSPARRRAIRGGALAIGFPQLRCYSESISAIDWLASPHSIGSATWR